MYTSDILTKQSTDNDLYKLWFVTQRTLSLFGKSTFWCFHERFYRARLPMLPQPWRFEFLHHLSLVFLMVLSSGNPGWSGWKHGCLNDNARNGAVTVACSLYRRHHTVHNWLHQSISLFLRNWRLYWPLAAPKSTSLIIQNHTCNCPKLMSSEIMSGDCVKPARRVGVSDP